jgi:hypothetical protein
MTTTKLPDTIMFKNIKIINYDQTFFQKYCSFCDNVATKIITRTSILTNKAQMIYVCDNCLESEITGTNKYKKE